MRLLFSQLIDLFSWQGTQTLHLYLPTSATQRVQIPFAGSISPSSLQHTPTFPHFDISSWLTFLTVAYVYDACFFMYTHMIKLLYKLRQLL